MRKWGVSSNPAMRVSMAALLLALALAGLAACSGGSAKGTQPQDPAIPVKITVAHSVSLSDTTEYVATLKSRASAVIMPQVEGYITRIYVHSGDHVSPTTLMMQIDSSKQEAAVRSQEDAHAAQAANLKYAQQQYDRISKLYEAGVASRQEFDQARTSLDWAQAQLRSLEAQVREQKVQLHYYKVVSQTSGIVGDIPVRVGDRVTDTTVLTTVDQPGTLEAYIYIPVERSAQLRMSMPVQIVDGAGNVIADSRVSFISPQVDSTTQTLLVKATIANHEDKLRNAQFVRARVVWGAHEGLVIPVLAVSRVGGQYFAFVAEDQNGKLVARQKPLRVSDMVGNDYVVLEGIKSGDRIIVSGTQFLVDGTPVTPQEGS